MRGPRGGTSWRGTGLEEEWAIGERRVDMGGCDAELMYTRVVGVAEQIGSNPCVAMACTVRRPVCD